MYNHAPENYVCPFCQLVRGTEDKDVISAQSDIIYHDETVTAFVSSHQGVNNPVNVVVIPNEHYENIFDLPIHYAADIHRTAMRIALAMKKVYSCDGISTRQHNEPAGNQDVWHYHLHITPRYKNDHFYSTHLKIMPIGERATHAKKLKDCLERQSEKNIVVQS